MPDVYTQAFVIEKDSKRFPKNGGWGYALFNYDAASDNFTADPTALRLRTCVPCGRQDKGLHLPPVTEALNRASDECVPEGAEALRHLVGKAAHRHVEVDRVARSDAGLAADAQGEPGPTPASAQARTAMGSQ